MRDSTIFAQEYLKDLNAKREQAKDMCRLTLTTYHYHLPLTNYYLPRTTYHLLLTT